MTLHSDRVGPPLRAPIPRFRRSALLMLPNRAAFLANHFLAAETDGVFVPDHLHLSIGDDVDLEIVFANPPMVFHTRGVVRWKRLRGGRDLAPGIGIEYAADEHEVRDLLDDFARGRPTRARPRSRRFPVALPIHLDDGRVGYTRDLSRHGASLSLPGPVPEPGDCLRLRMRGSEGRSLEVQAKVVWIQTTPVRIVGIRFLFPDIATKNAVSDLLAAHRGRAERQAVRTQGRESGR